jgi:hypothetical protein
MSGWFSLSPRAATPENSDNNQIYILLDDPRPRAVEGYNPQPASLDPLFLAGNFPTVLYEFPKCDSLINQIGYMITANIRLYK